MNPYKNQGRWDFSKEKAAGAQGNKVKLCGKSGSERRSSPTPQQSAVFHEGKRVSRNREHVEMMDHLALTTCRNLGLAQQGGGHQRAASERKSNMDIQPTEGSQNWRALGCSGNTPGTIRQIQPIKGQSL